MVDVLLALIECIEDDHFLASDIVGKDRELGLHVLEARPSGDLVKLVIALVFKSVNALQMDILVVLSNRHGLNHYVV